MSDDTSRPIVPMCLLMFPLPLALFALAGCEESAYWSRPRATTADLRRDLADCERAATGPTPFHFWALGLSYEAARNRIAERKAACMMERGWMPTAGSGSCVIFKRNLRLVERQTLTQRFSGAARKF